MKKHGNLDKKMEDEKNGNLEKNLRYLKIWNLFGKFFKNLKKKIEIWIKNSEIWKKFEFGKSLESWKKWKERKLKIWKTLETRKKLEIWNKFWNW